MYYAQHYIGAPEVEVFETRKERDKWVSYDTDYDKVENTKKYEGNNRVAITVRQAEYFVGKNLFRKGKYVQDPNNPAAKIAYRGDVITDENGLTFQKVRL